MAESGQESEWISITQAVYCVAHNAPMLPDELFSALGKKFNKSDKLISGAIECVLIELMGGWVEASGHVTFGPPDFPDDPLKYRRENVPLRKEIWRRNSRSGLANYTILKIDKHYFREIYFGSYINETQTKEDENECQQLMDGLELNWEREVFVEDIEADNIQLRKADLRERFDLKEYERPSDLKQA